MRRRDQFVLFWITVEAVPRPVDRLWTAVGRSGRPVPAQGADEEVHLQPESDEEHDEDRYRSPEEMRTDDPREHEDDEPDAEPEPRRPACFAHGATVAAGTG